MGDLDEIATAGCHKIPTRRVGICQKAHFLHSSTPQAHFNNDYNIYITSQQMHLFNIPIILFTAVALPSPPTVLLALEIPACSAAPSHSLFMMLFFLSEFDHLLMLPWFYYSFRFLIPSLYPPYGGAHLSLSTFAVEWTIFKLFPDFHHPSTVLSLFMTFFPCPYFDRLLMSLWFYSLSLRFCFFFLFLSFVFLLFFVQFLHVRLTMFVVGVCWTYCPPALPLSAGRPFPRLIST